MRKLLALLPAAALLLAGCGDTCTTKSTEVVESTSAPVRCNGASVAAGPVTITARPACQSCADSSPQCAISPASATEVHLDVQVKECDSNKGCSSASCAFGNVACALVIAPTFSGPLDIVYLTGGTTGRATVTVGGPGTQVTACTI